MPVSPLAGNNFAYVKDSGDFVEKIRNMQLSENDILVSFGVKSLFTQVPIEDALEVIGRKLEKHDDSLQTPLPLDDSLQTPLPLASIKDLLRMCLTSTYFMRNEEFYEQEDCYLTTLSITIYIFYIYLYHHRLKLIQLLQGKGLLARSKDCETCNNGTCMVFMNEQNEDLRMAILGNVQYATQ